GFTIAWRMETTRGFHAIMNLFLLPMWFLSGAFFPAAGASPVLRYVMYLNPVTYAVDAVRQGLYLPDAAPVAFAPLGASLLVTALFAGALILMASLTAKRSLYG